MVINVFADSNLTSTIFFDVYLEGCSAIECRLFKEAKESNKLTEEMAQFLADDRRSLDVRLALVNALGWNYYSGDENKDRNNASIFEQYLLKKYDINSISSNKWMILAYLSAMENYHNPKRAQTFIRNALVKPYPQEGLQPTFARRIVQPLRWGMESFAFDLIRLLIKTHFDAVNSGDFRYRPSWSKFAALLERYMIRKSKLDMKPSAIDRIISYVTSYSDGQEGAILLNWFFRDTTPRGARRTACRNLKTSSS